MKTSLINGLYILVFSILASLMASCLGSDYSEDSYPLTDAQLLSFSLSSDSVSDLANVVFSIDQRNGLIYNYDSMAYQTLIKDKVIVTYVSGAGSNNVQNITNGDSVFVQSGDSLDISIPQTLKVYAQDGINTKQYIVQLNIHQVDPDSMQYHRVASGLSFLNTEDTKTVVFNNRYLTYSKIANQIQLHTSLDAVTWTSDSFSGLPANAVLKGIQSSGDKLFAYTDDGELYVDSVGNQWELVNKPASIKVKSILGYLTAGPYQPAGLSMVIENGDVYSFAFTSDFVQWEYDSTPVPDNFPLSDFSNISYQVMLTGRISIFGGISSNGLVLNSVWSTEDGRYWANLTDGSINAFPPLEGANVFTYNGEFWLINGKSGNDYNADIYYSIDGGVTWMTKPDKYLMPADYPLRYNASLVMDVNNKYFYILGGKNSAVFLDVWKGFINKMEFDH